MAKTFRIVEVIDGVPTFEVPIEQVWEGCKPGGAYKRLDPLEYHTAQQRKWYKGVCLRGLSEWNGDTENEWDLRLKAECGGNELLKKEAVYLGPGTVCYRLTIVGVGKKNMTAFIENILSRAITMEWPVTPPDAELRKI